MSNWGWCLHKDSIILRQGLWECTNEAHLSSWCQTRSPQPLPSPKSGSPPRLARHIGIGSCFPRDLKKLQFTWRLLLDLKDIHTLSVLCLLVHSRLWLSIVRPVWSFRLTNYSKAQFAFYTLHREEEFISHDPHNQDFNRQRDYPCIAEKGVKVTHSHAGGKR